MPWGFVICHGPLNLTTVGTHLGGSMEGKHMVLLGTGSQFSSLGVVSMQRQQQRGHCIVTA